MWNGNNWHHVVIFTRDISAFVLVEIHFNLCISTISSFTKSRPDLSSLLTNLLNFKVYSAFMLIEIGHGLDARNLETTATLLPSGEFDLHTPTQEAAKAMPPATPLLRRPRIGIIFARLIMKHEDHGIKPFVVWLNDSINMREGITSYVLSTRPGTKPLDYSITSFDHVRLPLDALLSTLSKSKD